MLLSLLSPSSWLLLVLAASSNSGTEAHFPRNASSHFNIQIPHSLHRDAGDGFPHQISHFGSHWNADVAEGNLVQHIQYFSSYSKLCHEPKVNQTLTWEDPPFLLLVDRGDCTFVTKVRRAQKLGATGVLIADDRCLCDEANCTDTVRGDTTCETTPPVIANDGSGQDISIPSVLLRKSDADLIKEALSKKQTVVAELGWHVPKFEDSVQMDLWHTPSSHSTSHFLTNFSTLALTLQDHLAFTPHFYLLDGIALKCHGNAEKEQDACYTMCTSNGRYCSVSHTLGVTGTQVVLESLRRMCIWKHNPGVAFWMYVDHFAEWCASSSDFFSDEKCLKDAYLHSKLDPETVETCMKDSGDVDVDQTNTLLEHSISTIKNWGIVQTPALLINHFPFTKSLTPQNVLQAICNGFDYGLAPHVCYACGSCGDPVACAKRSPMKCDAHDGEEKEATKKSSKKKKGGKIFKWMFFLALFGGVGGYLYYKKYMEDSDGGHSYSLTSALMSDT